MAKTKQQNKAEYGGRWGGRWDAKVIVGSGIHILKSSIKRVGPDTACYTFYFTFFY